ncbi:MAG TPA: O-antigen polysaccharide polymerase Wzy [Gemmataceae bacterium]|jgi:oligosaccharide repeat unit polymerase|nr:O-antigen polysaccharide polymerase Wzy [Gemmataceae bacterium]
MPAVYVPADPPHPKTCTAFVLVHCAIMGLGAVVGLTWPWGFWDVPVPTLVRACSVVLLLLFGWSFWSWAALTGSWFDPYSIFLVAANLFNAGQAFLEALNLNPFGILPGLFTPETVLKTLFMVFLGLGALHLGALLSVGMVAGRSSEPGPADRHWSPSAADVRAAGWVLLLISFVPTVLVLKDAVDLVLSSGYSALYQREKVTGLSNAPQILSTFLVPAALFMLAGSKGAPVSRAVSAMMILAQACCQLFLGYRYHAVMPVVAYLWVWHQCIRPLSRSAVLATVAGLVFIVFPVVAATRDVRGQERLSVEFLKSAFSSIDNPAAKTVNEMGGSMQTVAHTLERVPAERDYDGGVGYLYGLFTIFPNLFWDIHPAIAYGTPSSWLIWAVDPYIASMGGGLGYSFIAEAYFNFGWLGVPAVTGLLGLIYGAFAVWALRGGPHRTARLALVASFCSFFTFYAREDLAEVFRSLVWYSLGPYLLVFVIYSLRGRPAQPLVSQPSAGPLPAPQQ